MRIKLRQARKQKHLSQQAVAQALAIDQSYYSRIETGVYDLSLDLGLKLSRLLDVAPDDLMVIDSPEPEPEPALAATPED